MKETYTSKMYCKHNHPFAYATCTNFGGGKGLLQIHSDWGTYSHFWGSIGDESIEQFVTRIDPGYLETKLRINMNQMGMKKESFVRLTKFMAQCWPDLKDLIEKTPAQNEEA